MRPGTSSPPPRWTCPLTRILGISVCEDAWYEPELWNRCLYPLDPIKVLAGLGASVLINISGSPFQVGKQEVRHRLLRYHARNYGLPVVYVNQVGGNDELIFDGRSLALDRAGEAIAVLPAFQEAVVTVDLAQAGAAGLYRPQETIATVHEALVLGLRDYLGKCGFKQAVMGLSGGVDSAVTCCLAAAALGPENVLGVLMPSPYTSRDSIDDSLVLARPTWGWKPGSFPSPPFTRATGRPWRDPCSWGRSKSPWKISRPASGATSSWPSPTNSATWSCPPATKANWRWATAPSTGT